MRLRVAGDLVPRVVSRLVGWAGDRPIHDANDGAVVLELMPISALREPMDHAAITALQEARNKMRLDAMEIGEPCVEVPMDSLSVYKDSNGDWRAIISMASLIHLVDHVLRTNQ